MPPEIDSDLPPRGPFFDALDAYRAAFRDVPHTFGIGPNRLDALAPAMRAAIARGEPLTAAEVAEALALPPEDKP